VKLVSSRDGRVRSPASTRRNTLDRNMANRSHVQNNENASYKSHVQSIDNTAYRSHVQNNNNAASRASVQEQRVPRSGTGKATTKASEKKSHVKTIVIIMSVIVFGFAALFVSLGFYVASLDTIFPNVWADGVKVSGLSIEEATQALIDDGYERNAESIAVTLVFPDDSMFSVSGDEVGLALNAGEAAMTAFMFGRDESFFRNEITYIRALFNRTDLNDLSTPVFDDSAIRELTSEYTAKFNETLIDSNSNITDDGITIVKGTGLHPANENAVFELAIATLEQAVKENEHLTSNYVPERNDDTIDLQFLFSEIHEEPVSSWYDPETKDASISSDGRTFDLAAAEEKLRNAEYGSSIFIPIEILEPEHSQEEIRSWLFRDQLHETTTSMGSSSANRIRNIEVAAGFINETILEPGEVFSFNAVVGRRTADRGFRMAGVFQGGVLIDGVGGGICQMSSTLYDAVLHTHLRVVERRPHTFRITYLPPGNDATVAYDSNTDFKFENSTDFPIKIYSTLSENRRQLTVRLQGTNVDGTYIEIETVTISETPVRAADRESDEHLLGERVPLEGSSGIPGITVETFKLIYTEEGELIERVLVNRSVYSMQQNITLVGTLSYEEWLALQGSEPEGEPISN